MAARLIATFVAFVAGFVVLVLELVGARLLAPTFGISVVPWTAAISVILAGLALGNWAGGRIADRRFPPLHGLFLAAIVAVLLPLSAERITASLFDALGIVGGALLSAALLFGPAAFLLGCVVPYLIRLDTRGLHEVGRRSGDLGGAASAGAIAGTLATGFYLIPTFPVDRILAGSGLVLLIAAGACRWLEALAGQNHSEEAR